MHSEQPSERKRPRNAEQPFPWRCRHCGQERVVPTTISYEAEVRHDGRLHTFAIPSLTLPVCQACSEKVFTEKVEDQITAALRSHLHFFAPEEIRAGLERVQMTQKEAAERLGVAEATLSRWLTETQIQTRAMDNLLRVFFAFPEVRVALCGALQDPGLGTRDVLGNRDRDTVSARAPGVTDPNFNMPRRRIVFETSPPEVGLNRFRSLSEKDTARLSVRSRQFRLQIDLVESN